MRGFLRHKTQMMGVQSRDKNIFLYVKKKVYYSKYILI